MAKGTNPLVLKRRVNEVKFLEKHLVEGKTVAQCSQELGLTPQTLFDYKKGKNYRQMALMYLEDATLGGMKGTVKRLIIALDATKPIVMVDKEEDENGNKFEKTRIESVPDEKTRLDAIKEIGKIYGWHAPQKRDTKIAISFSSDAELFEQIEQAQRDCGLVEQYEEGEKGFELAQGESGRGDGNFEKRERTVLQDGSVPQPQ